LTALKAKYDPLSISRIRHYAYNVGMRSTSPALTFENNLSLADRQSRRLAYFSFGIYLVSLILTLGAVLWNTPAPWGRREAVLVILVSLQVVIYAVWFVATHYLRWPLTWPWLSGYLLLSLGLWLIQWQLEAAFWWIIWIQVCQVYTFLPLKAAIPVTGLIFFVFTYFDPGLKQFFDLPLDEVVVILIRWVLVSMLCAFVALLTRANQERARLIAELQIAKQAEVELAALRERERLARDLHDSLGHALVALSVQLEAVQRLYPVNPEGASRQIDKMKTLTRASMEALRHTLAGLRAPGLNNRPLAQALADLSTETGQRAGLEVTCRVDPEVNQLGPAMTEVLWRVTQEALMNVEKHAVAHRVQLDLQLKQTAVTLRVADDGVGLPSDLTNRPGHYGLWGMRERIEGLGGVLNVDGNGQAGTVVEASLPLIGSKEYLQED
jgi:signal transduction histidine kinase